MRLFNKIVQTIRNRKFKKRIGECGRGVCVTGSFDIEKGKYIKIGDNFICNDHFVVRCFDERLNERYNPELIIGNGVCINPNFKALVADKLVIGDNVLIASDVFITTENHGMNPMLDYGGQRLVTAGVEIGSGCWIGERVVILPGVTIGTKSIVGAGSVVTKDVPDYCIAVGCPAVIIKRYNLETQRWERVKNG